MEKPKRPKKPSPPKIKEPVPEITEHYYPYSSLSRTGDDWDWNTRPTLKFLLAENIPWDDNDTQEFQDWFDANEAKSDLSLQELLSFAEGQGIALSKIQVGAIIPHRGSDYTHMELKVLRQLSPEEFSHSQEVYNQTMAEHNAKLEEYEQNKATFPRRKAEYELWLAQQKLAEIRNQ